MRIVLSPAPNGSLREMGRGTIFIYLIKPITLVDYEIANKA